MKSTLNYLHNKYSTVHLTGNKGDVFLINSRNVHWATPLKTGIRIRELFLILVTGDSDSRHNFPLRVCP